VLDAQDAAHEARVRALAVQTLVTNTVMRTDEDRRRLAEEILEWSESL
jgi:hypothetical protein